MTNEEQGTNLMSNLENLIREIPNLSKEDFYHKIIDLKRINERFYLNNQSYCSEIDYVSTNIGAYLGTNSDKLGWGHSLQYYKDYLVNTINSMLLEVKSFGIPLENDIKIKPSINISNIQSQSQEQNQTQTITISFLLEILKDSLTSEQINEIKEIAKNETVPNKAKPKVLQKILSFGGNTFSNILASLITNPDIWKYLTNN